MQKLSEPKQFRSFFHLKSRSMGFFLDFITAIFIILIVGLFSPTNSQRKPQTSNSIVKRIKERGEADIRLREKLISLLGGDREKAEKLVARKRFGKGGNTLRTIIGG
jgi:hypothetical protein